MEKYISAEKVSETSRFSLGALREICETGMVEAKNVGQRWFISEVDLRERLFTGQVVGFLNSFERFQKLRVVLIILIGLVFLSGFLLSGAETGLLTVALFHLEFKLPLPENVRLNASLPNSVSDGLTVLANYWSEKPAGIINELFDNWNFLKERVVTNWQYFLGVAEPPNQPPAESITPISSPLSLDPALAKAIERYIEQQIAARLADRSPKAVIGPGGTGSPLGGLVTVPSSGDPFIDYEVRKRLQEAFSDKVTVKFDSSGTSGIITPVFRDASAADYLFVLTPLKQR